MLFNITLRPTPCPLLTFSLRELAIFSPRGPLDVLNPLFAPSLRHLNLHCRPEEYPAFQEAFTIVSPHLEVFEFHSPPPSSWYHILPNCLNLSHLHFSGWCDDNFFVFLNHYPPTLLQTLTLGDRNWDRISDGVLKLLASVNVRNLTTIYVENVTQRDFTECARGEEVLRKWEERGVNVVFGRELTFNI